MVDATTPHLTLSVQRWGVWAPKLKILPKFPHINAGICLEQFSPNYHHLWELHVRSCIKIWVDSLKGFQRRMRTYFRGARTVCTYSITVPSLVGSDIARRQGGGISIFLSVTLLNDKDVNAILSSKLWNTETSWYRWIGECFVVVHPLSTLSVQRWVEPPQNDEVENMAKFGIFHLLKMICNDFWGC